MIAFLASGVPVFKPAGGAVTEAAIRGIGSLSRALVFPSEKSGIYTYVDVRPREGFI